MDIFKLVGFCIFAIVMIIILKEQRPEMSLILTIFTCVCLMLFAMSKMSFIIDMLNSLVDASGMNTDFLQIILKITAIAYIVEFGKNICVDSGQTAIASRLEMAGKVIILTLSIPLISSLVNLVSNLI